MSLQDLLQRTGFDDRSGGRQAHRGAFADLLDATDDEPTTREPRDRSALDALKQSGRLFLRGAGAEGLYAGIEGAARMVSGVPELAGEAVAKLEDLRDMASEMSPHEQLARAEERRARNRERLRDVPADAPRTAAALAAVKGYADAAQGTRSDIRKALPVDEDFASSLPGQIVQGLGQAAGTLPMFAVPGAGPGVTFGQLYQQGYDDAKGHGADDAKAHLAGAANLPASALDVAADRLIIGKILKPLRGKTKVRDLIKDVLAAGASEGATEGAQQAWQNVVARELAGYDPDRPLDDQVMRSMLVGLAVGGITTGAGRAGTEGVARLRDSGMPGRSPEAESTPAEQAPDFEALTRDLESVRSRLSRRPVEEFKTKLETPDDADTGILNDLAEYARLTDRPDEDFANWAQRMETEHGAKAQPYLPLAWDAVKGGKPVVDLTPPENPAEIDGAWSRALKFGRLFWEGSGDVLRRGGFTDLASAVDRHVDLTERNLAQAWNHVRQELAPLSGLRGMADRSTRNQAREQFAAFYRAKENGRAQEALNILTDASPETRKLVEAAGRLFTYTGFQNQRLGVKVFDRNGGTWRPAGNLGSAYWPRVINDDTAAVLRDPSSNPQRWEQMKQELLDNGNIQSLEEADQFLRERHTRERSDDFFANLELARTGKLPESWHEYDPLKVIPRFVSRWAERSAQIEAFGQKIGDEGVDAFDRAAQTAKSETARNYIEATREHAYRIGRADPAGRQFIGNVTSATTGLLLGNPWSAARNLIGGLAQTANQFGAYRALKALGRTFRSIPDAEAAGAVKADVADLLFAGQDTPGMRQAVNLALKAGGFSQAETFVRAHAYLTAKTFLREAVAAARAKPFGRRTLQDMAFIRRTGTDPAALLTEGGRGPLTESFLRGAVREGQGGYRYNQVPLFVDSPIGRFLFQFARWGTQAARFHVRNTIRPAILGDVVKVRDGDKVVEKRVRTLLPLLRSPLVAMGAGALTLAMREALLGIERADAGWDEIWRTKNENERRAFALALDRAANDIIFAGTFGAISDYSALLKDAATRSRFRNPVEPPAVSLMKEAGALAYKLAQQGQLTREDYERFFNAAVSAYRVGSKMAFNFSDKIGADWERARLARADRDKMFVRRAGARFADEAGLEVNPYQPGALPNVSERTPVYAQIEDALLLGDALKASQLADEFLGEVEAGKTKRARAALVASVRSRQPVKPGGSTSADLQREFVGWARRRLSEAELRRIMDVQERYMETAVDARILPAAALERWRAMLRQAEAAPRIESASPAQSQAAPPPPATSNATRASSRAFDLPSLNGEGDADTPTPGPLEQSAGYAVG